MIESVKPQFSLSPTTHRPSCPLLFIVPGAAGWLDSRFIIGRSRKDPLQLLILKIAVKGNAGPGMWRKCSLAAVGTGCGDVPEVPLQCSTDSVSAIVKVAVFKCDSLVREGSHFQLSCT